MRLGSDPEVADSADAVAASKEISLCCPLPQLDGIGVAGAL
jgi:hypothetical protein